MDKVVHFEIPADNTDRAKKFYREAFDWQMEDIPEMKYIMLKTIDSEDNMPPNMGINGGMIKRGEPSTLINSPSFAINVSDIDVAIKKIKNAGGLILKEKSLVGDMGFMSYFKDTEGNILSIWQAKNQENL